VNLVAPLRLGEQALEVLEPGGAQVFIASTLATRPVLTSAVYSAAKAGLLQVMKVLALAGAARGVRASAVLPGVGETDMVRGVRRAPGGGPLSGPEHARRQEAQLAGLRALHPLGRLGRPEDVAEAVRYLLGASWISGSELVL